MSPEVMLRQVELLAADLSQLTGEVEQQVRRLPLGGVRQVVLVGDGDSYHAAIAAQLATETFADLTCTPESALPFSEYGAPRLARLPAGTVLVVGVSASGRTERVVAAIERAEQYGADTVALTGVAGSPLTEAARHAVVVAPSGLERSPGIRTYQASLLGLLLLAVHLGQLRDVLAAPTVRSVRDEFAALPDLLSATNEALRGPCAEVAGAILTAGPVAVAGSGPNYGTARYAAAKLVEGCGVLAFGQDLEEWCHVERFAYPLDMPVFVLAPPGRSRPHALRTAEKASAAGRRVIAVGAADDHELCKYSRRTLPVTAPVREEFTPLLYHSFASIVATSLALRLRRGPFLT